MLSNMLINEPTRQVFYRFLFWALLFNLVLSSAIFSDYYTGKLAWERIVTDYNLVQHQAHYGLEFLKRGLMASLFVWLSITVNETNVFLLSYLIINVLFTLVWYLAYLAFGVSNGKRDRNRYFIFYILLFVCSPAVAMQFGVDFGRVDAVNLLIMSLSLLIILRGSLLTVYFFIPLLTVIALLIHELYLFTGLPLVLAALLAQQKFKIGGVVVIVSMVALVSLLWFGQADYNSTLEYLSANTGFNKNEFPITVWTNSVYDNMLFTFLRYANLTNWTGLVRDFAILLLYLALYLLPFKNIKLSKQHTLILLTPVAILPLFLIGIDFSRWVGLIIFNMFVAFLIVWIFIHKEKPSFRLPTISKKYTYLVYAAFVLLLTGPLGTT